MHSVPKRIDPGLQVRQLNSELMQVAQLPRQGATSPVNDLVIPRARKYPSFALAQTRGEVQAEQPVMIQVVQLPALL
jgi:hypothetical protein